MPDDPREVLMLAAQYKYGDIEVLKELDKQHSLVALLRKQKQYVDVYSLESADNAIQTENSLISVMVSSDYRRLKAKYPAVAFTVPKEGSFVGLYSFAVVAQSEKQELAYEFIRYLYTPEVMHHHVKKFGYAPLISSLRKGITLTPSLYDYRDRDLQFFKNVIPDRLFNDLWIQVLS